MKRKYLICVVSVVLMIIVSLTVIANITSFQNEIDKKIYVAEEYNVNIEIDGIKPEYDLPIVTINGNTYIPLRETFEICGYDVEWNSGNPDSIDVNINIDKHGKMIIKNTVGIEFPECAVISEFTSDPNPISEDGSYAAKIEVSQQNWEAVKNVLEEKMHLKSIYDDSLWLVHNHLSYNNEDYDWWELKEYTDDLIYYSKVHTGNVVKTMFAHAFVVKTDESYVIYFEHTGIGF